MMGGYLEDRFVQVALSIELDTLLSVLSSLPRRTLHRCFPLLSLLLFLFLAPSLFLSFSLVPPSLSLSLSSPVSRSVPLAALPFSVFSVTP